MTRFIGPSFQPNVVPSPEVFKGSLEMGEVPLEWAENPQTLKEAIICWGDRQRSVREPEIRGGGKRASDTKSSGATQTSGRQGDQFPYGSKWPYEEVL